MTATEPQLKQLPIKDVIPTKDNPRRILKDAPETLELVESIKQLGVLEPVLVRAHPKKKGKWDLRAGARRLLAAELAGLETIPAVVRPMDDRTALQVTVIENLQREELRPLEEARGINTLLGKKWSVEDIAEDLGKSPAWVARRANLTKLTDPWQKAVEDPEHEASDWPVGHLELVARMEPHIQEKVFSNFGSKKQPKDPWWTPYLPRLSKLERDIGKELHELRSAHWKLDDAELLSDVGACAKCLKRSSCKPLLFADMQPDAGKKKGDRCLDGDCWNAKLDAYIQREAELAHAEFAGKLLYIKEWRDEDVKIRLPEAETVGQYDVTDVKPTARGARPAIVITGDHKGQMRWVSLRKGAAPKKAPGGPKPLSERREALAGRRAKLTIEMIREVLADSTAPAQNTLGNLVALAAAFGLSPPEVVKGVTQGGDEWEQHKIYAEDKGLGKAALWEGLKQRLAGEMVFYNTAGTVGRLEAAQKICEVLGVDFEAFARMAEEQIPEPKSWAKLNEDGTPKKTAKPKKSGSPPTKGVCRVCGCTESTPCVNGAGESCAWADRTQTLCTFCAAKGKA